MTHHVKTQQPRHIATGGACRNIHNADYTRGFRDCAQILRTIPPEHLMTVLDIIAMTTIGDEEPE